MQSGLTLVLGGAASGKSAFGEMLVTASAKPWIYIATAQAFDAEMRAKIDEHVQQRGDGWTTREAPLELAAALADLHDGETCLLDCLTMWLSNKMLAGADLAEAQHTLVAAIDACEAELVIVSNEVGHGIVPDNALARRFREAQGRLNIALAARAARVVQVTAGLPRVLKGAPL